MQMKTAITRTGLGPAPVGHPHVKPAKVGILLANLGTPDGTDYWSMWRYLREFLSDKRVIELPRLVWQPILHTFVLTTRPQKSGANYRTIWNNEKDESPLRTITREQVEALRERLADQPEVVVEYGMRYGSPSIATAVAQLQEQGADRIVYFPLYPQYSATTTATANDQLFRALMKLRNMPATRTVPAYYDEPAYIEALAHSVEAHLAALDFEPEMILASYHGIPKRYFEAGDPYHCHCHKTTRLLRERLGYDDKRLITTFQSLFGKAEWIKPYTAATVEKLAHEGVKRIAIINPGFSADCIETLEEIAGEVRDEFIEAGGEKFAHIPCLNASEGGMNLIEALVRREMAGWA
ncbi:ferrochelatase [Limoniibacter endophyticus]|uniref:Ferrochelatase n=1 Tax=Limoniibacter endophyticus TaxID=1565040 RepID=A0A8J3DLG1_9HYPH|nr:ferrochelatase [Limoniibacter endophyticus]GHC64156.1 ferrochelatase [Limoniibacter endophyticus]